MREEKKNETGDKRQGTDGTKGPEGTVALEELQQKCEEYLGGWKRALADYDNLKKDLARERAEMRQGVCVDAGAALVPVLDNFDAAVRFVPENADDKTKNWLQGILFVRNQLEDVMRGIGLEPFGQIGEPFDPNRHDSAGEKAVEGSEPNTVVDVVMRGWKMGDRVVRPAKVIVSK